MKAMTARPPTRSRTEPRARRRHSTKPPSPLHSAHAATNEKPPERHPPARPLPAPSSPGSILGSITQASPLGSFCSTYQPGKTTTPRTRKRFYSSLAGLLALLHSPGTGQLEA